MEALEPTAAAMVRPPPVVMAKPVMEPLMATLPAAPC